MEYVYTAMLLHSAGKEVSEDSVTKVMQAAGAKCDSARVKALIASLKDVNIEEAIEKAAQAPAAAPAAAPAEAAGEAKAEKKEEEQGKTEEEAAEGLGSLFG